MKIGIKALKRRRANNDEEDEYEEIDPSYIPPLPRRQGAPAYMRVSLKTFGVYGMIVDSESRLLPEKIVRYDSLLENLLCRAINHFDSFEQTRFTMWNRRMIIYQARKRIQYWLHHLAGSRHVNVPGEENFALKRPQFAQQVMFRTQVANGTLVSRMKRVLK
jgi:hypothetical protein